MTCTLTAAPAHTGFAGDFVIFAGPTFLGVFQVVDGEVVDGEADEATVIGALGEGWADAIVAACAA